MHNYFWKTQQGNKTKNVQSHLGAGPLERDHIHSLNMELFCPKRCRHAFEHCCATMNWRGDTRGNYYHHEVHRFIFMISWFSCYDWWNGAPWIGIQKSAYPRLPAAQWHICSGHRPIFLLEETVHRISGLKGFKRICFQVHSTTVGRVIDLVNLVILYQSSKYWNISCPRDSQMSQPAAPEIPWNILKYLEIHQGDSNLLCIIGSTSREASPTASGAPDKVSFNCSWELPQQ